MMNTNVPAPLVPTAEPVVEQEEEVFALGLPNTVILTLTLASQFTLTMTKLNLEVPDDDLDDLEARMAALAS